MSVEPAMPAQKISVFGGGRVQAACGQTIPFSGQKDQALPGFLAVSPGVNYSREKLAAMLWSDSGDRQARDSLKQALLRLRRSLDPFGKELLVTDRQSVMLASDSVRVDVVLFEDLMRDQVPESIERAASLYSGDLLDGIQVRDATFEDWLELERQRLRTLATSAWTDFMKQSFNRGQHKRAVGAARQLLSFDPLHETACRILMHAHVERGERTQALKLFERLQSRLQQELAVAPEPETVALYQSIRNRYASKRVTGRGAVTSTADGAKIADQLGFNKPAGPSIAVLPFSIIGNDTEKDYFADGLTEDIITDLSQISGLFVVSRHCAFMFKGEQIQIQRIARELNVSYILEGSVRATTDRVRILHS